MSERTIWSLRERIEVGIWKRYKIGDRELDTRRFYRSKVYFNINSKLHFFLVSLL